MPATVLTVDPQHPQTDIIARAAEHLRLGKLVAFPTETVYGLGSHALDPDAVARIFEAKGRPATNPLIVHVSDVTSARELVVAWPEAAERLTLRFWPGPLTIVLPKRANVPDIATAGGSTVAIRSPAHPVARALILAAGFPIAAPSANTSNRISATTAEHVQKMLDDRIELILDGGPCSGGLESTVIDLSGEQPTLLRHGLVDVVALEAALGAKVALLDRDAKSAVLRSPGMLERHYAPMVPLECVPQGSELRNVEDSPHSTTGTLTFGPSPETLPKDSTIAMPTDVTGYSAALYDALHRMEQSGVQRIFVELPPDEPAWQAVRDRLRRASWR